MPERVVAAGVLGGWRPRGPTPSAAADGHWVRSRRRCRGGGRCRCGWPRRPDPVIRPVAEPASYVYARVSPEADRRLLVRPEFKAMFLDDLLNGSRKQLAAPIANVVVFARDWGSGSTRSRCPVRWWHGDRDHIVPFAHGQHVVSSCPTPSFTISRREPPRPASAAPRRSLAR